MPQTESNPIAIGTKAADIQLPDFRGREHHLVDFESKPGLQIIAINSNDAATHPEETLARIGQEVETYGYTFPYLKDETQEVAKAYGAACTPDFFLFGADRTLVYHGQFDDALPGNGKPVTGADLRAAVDAVLAGSKPAASQIPSIGCNIKWEPGNEPSWFSKAA